MLHRKFFPLMFIFASLMFVAACSSSEEVNSKDGAQGDESFQKVDQEESIIPETDEPVEIEVVEDEGEAEVEPVPIRDEEPAAATEAEPPAKQEAPPVEKTQPANVAPRSGSMMWSVQLGAFKNESGAFELVNELKNKFNQPVYKRYDAATGYYKVTLGSFQKRDEAASFKAEVQSLGYPDAFTVEVAR
ncbi:SPOR domain-containing protein [bacterium]|nr:SPOR domain-containing protein [bacterium]